MLTLTSFKYVHVCAAKGHRPGFVNHRFTCYPGLNQMFRTDGLWTLILLMITQNVCIAVVFLRFLIPTTKSTEQMQVAPDGTMQTPRFFAARTRGTVMHRTVLCHDCIRYSSNASARRNRALAHRYYRRFLLFGIFFTTVFGPPSFSGFSPLCAFP